MEKVSLEQRRRKKNTGRGVVAAGVARKWEGERRCQVPRSTTLTGSHRVNAPDKKDVRFDARGGKWKMQE
jgi:hypothetical protein